MKNWTIPELLLLAVAVIVAVFLLTCCGGGSDRPADSYGRPPPHSDPNLPQTVYPDDGSIFDHDGPTYSDDGMIEEAGPTCLDASAADCGVRIEGQWDLDLSCCVGTGCLIDVTPADCGVYIPGQWDGTCCVPTDDA